MHNHSAAFSHGLRTSVNRLCRTKALDLAVVGGLLGVHARAMRMPYMGRAAGHSPDEASMAARCRVLLEALAADVQPPATASAHLGIRAASREVKCEADGLAGLAHGAIRWRARDAT